MINFFISPIRTCTAILSVMFVSHAAAEPRTLTIQSKVDTFDLVLNGGRGTIGDKPADLSSIKELLPLLTKPLSNDCPALGGSPEVTVKDGEKTRSLYIKQGVISDGKTCLNVGGEGLWYFPIHRDFLIGPKRDQITLKAHTKLFKQGVKVLDLKKGPNGWANNDPSALLNWDFIEHFENSLRDYSVRFRVSMAMAAGKPKMILQTGEQTFEFYKITNVLWAVKRPGQPWLSASNDWSTWYEFDKSIFEDRLKEQIQTATDFSKPKEERLAAIQKTDGTWSINLREMFHKIVANKDEDPEIKKIAFKRLRTKPSKETAGVMATFLAGPSDDDELKKTATQILKINNPKGPLYDPESSAEEKAKVVEFWTQWWAKNRNNP